jgi:Trk K+ transport system NAD-binding subunit
VVVVHGDGRRLFNPPPSFRIESDDELVVIGPPEGVSAMLEELGE